MSLVARRYQLLSVLGRGGSAVVYEACDRQSGARVALKLLEGDKDAADVRRLLREARLLDALGHPSIVRVLDAGVLEDGGAFLAMERLEGCTLAQRLEDCFWLPQEEAIAIASQLLDALDAAHRAGVVHRDVTPSNVFLLPGSRVKLIDFGIGRELGDPQSRVTEPNLVLGTVGYMAPEQLFGDEPSVRSDVYGAGATLYEMLSGRPPLGLRSGELREILVALTSPPPSLRLIRPALPARLADGVMRALGRSPRERFESCREMIDGCGLLDAEAA